MASALIGEKLYLFCGYYPDDGGYSDKVVEIDTTTWHIRTLSTEFPFDGYNLGAATVGSKVYLFGGYGSYNDGSNGSNDCVIEFDAKTESAVGLDAKLPYTAQSVVALPVGSNIYLFGGASVNLFAASTPLASGTMVLQYTTGGDVFPVVNSDTLTVEVSPTAVYIGDADELAQPVEAFTYKDGAWTAI
jgi:hypothetical protein